jgi:hypothetical protein
VAALDLDGTRNRPGTTDAGAVFAVSETVEVTPRSSLGWRHTNRPHAGLSEGRQFLAVPRCASAVDAGPDQQAARNEPAEPNQRKRPLIGMSARIAAACCIAPRSGPGEARTRRRVRRSHCGCPRWSCGSHLACADPASHLGLERLKKGLLYSKQRCPPSSQPVMERARRSRWTPRRVGW